jgi:hypothetical protein
MPARANLGTFKPYLCLSRQEKLRLGPGRKAEDRLRLFKLIKCELHLSQDFFRRTVALP